MTDKKLVTIDGTDALAFVIIRPGAVKGAVALEAAANGMSKPAAAYTLRHIADTWDPPTTPTPAPGPDITPAVAAHVLHYMAGDDGGYPAAPFTAALLIAWEHADDTNKTVLNTAFPAYGAAITLLYQLDGRARLRAIAGGTAPAR